MPDVSLLQREYYGMEEEESAVPGIVSTISLIILILIIAAYAGLFVYNQYLIGRAQTISENIKGLRVGDVVDVVNQLKVLGDTAKALKDLREAHTATSSLLVTLETTTHPDVFFSSADFDLIKKSVKIKGTASATKTLARQVEIYQQEKAISAFSVDSLGYEGENKSVSFQADITFAR